MRHYGRRSILLSSGLIAVQCISTVYMASRANESNLEECMPSSFSISEIIEQRPIPPNSDIYMAPGDSIAIKSVHPKCKYYPTNIIVKPEEVYEFDSGGSWKDGWLPSSSPEGWNGLVLNLFNRLSGKNFFVLCGSIGKTDLTAFKIGKKMRWKVPQNAAGESGYLFLFPNDTDHAKFRKNNREVESNPLRVKIKRIS